MAAADSAPDVATPPDVPVVASRATDPVARAPVVTSPARAAAVVVPLEVEVELVPVLKPVLRPAMLKALGSNYISENPLALAIYGVMGLGVGVGASRLVSRISKSHITGREEV